MNLNETVQDWRKRNRLRKTDANLLLEAYRRFHAFAIREHKNLSNARVGLGMSEYDHSSFFTALYGRRRPRCDAWYGLTDKGKVILSDLNAHLPWKSEYNGDLFVAAFFS